MRSSKLNIPFIFLLTVLSCNTNKGLTPRMTMSDVEKILGKPNSVKKEKGYITDNLEYPGKIIWTYESYPWTLSDKNYGTPGYLNFVPERFLTSTISKSDSVAWEYGEQSDSYRLVSYQGSFPIDKNLKWEGGGLGIIPIKELK